MPDTGLALTSARVKGIGTEPKYLDSGTGTTPPVAGNTGLETPHGEDRVAGTSTQQTTTTTDDTYQVVGTISYGSAGNITEVGLFDASTVGNLYVRATFDAIAVLSGDQIIFTVQAVYNQA